MKKIIVTVFLTILTVFLCLCSAAMKSSESKNTEWSDPEVPEDQILLISRYINYAEGYYNRGTFIDSGGEVYFFDFSDQEDTLRSDETNAKFIKKLQTVKKIEKPCMHLDPDIVKRIYYYSGKIDKNAEFKGKYEACDAGEDQIYILDNENNELVLCCEDGDYCGVLEDSYASNLITFFNKNLRENIHDCISEK